MRQHDKSGNPGSTPAARRASRPSARPEDMEWRLPSGEDLIAFAVGVGLAASPLAGEPEAPAGGDEQGAEAVRLRKEERGA